MFISDLRNVSIYQYDRNPKGHYRYTFLCVCVYFIRLKNMYVGRGHTASQNKGKVLRAAGLPAGGGGGGGA